VSVFGVQASCYRSTKFLSTQVALDCLDDAPIMCNERRCHQTRSQRDLNIASLGAFVHPSWLSAAPAPTVEARVLGTRCPTSEMINAVVAVVLKVMLMATEVCLRPAGREALLQTIVVAQAAALVKVAPTLVVHRVMSKDDLPSSSGGRQLLPELRNVDFQVVYGVRVSAPHVTLATIGIQRKELGRASSW